MSSFLSSQALSVAQESLRIENYNITVKERLAEGGFGFVDLVFDNNSKIEYVLKRCTVSTNESYDVAQKEIKILQRFKGPYIVQILGSDIIQNRTGANEALILLEYCPGGHMLDRLIKRKGQLLPIESIYRICGQLLLALKSFHNNEIPIVHRDLKLENILFGSDGNARLCDFGSCVFGNVYLRDNTERSDAEEIISKQTTQMYRAPEMIDLYLRQVLTEKTDIWALGCIFYAICFLTHPFQDAGSLGILNAKIVMPNNELIPNDMRVVITRMLDVDPEARPNVEELFLAISALATGKPLPQYEISAEALQIKREREESNRRREQKTKKSYVSQPAVPVRKAPVELSGNSVAARRLAAKQGLPVQSITHQQASTFDSFSNNTVFHGNKSSSVSSMTPHVESSNTVVFDGFSVPSIVQSSDPFSDQFASSNDFSTRSYVNAAHSGYIAETLIDFQDTPQTAVNTSINHSVNNSNDLFDVLTDNTTHHSHSHNADTSQFNPVPISTPETHTSSTQFDFDAFKPVSIDFGTNFQANKNLSSNDKPNNTVKSMNAVQDSIFEPLSSISWDNVSTGVSTNPFGAVSTGFDAFTDFDQIKSNTQSSSNASKSFDVFESVNVKKSVVSASVLDRNHVMIFDQIQQTAHEQLPSTSDINLFDSFESINASPTRIHQPTTSRITTGMPGNVDLLDISSLESNYGDTKDRSTDDLRQNFDILATLGLSPKSSSTQDVFGTGSAILPITKSTTTQLLEFLQPSSSVAPVPSRPSDLVFMNKPPPVNPFQPSSNLASVLPSHNPISDSMSDLDSIPSNRLNTRLSINKSSYQYTSHNDVLGVSGSNEVIGNKFPGGVAKDPFDGLSFNNININR